MKRQNLPWQPDLPQIFHFSELNLFAQIFPIFQSYIIRTSRPYEICNHSGPPKIFEGLPNESSFMSAGKYKNQSETSLVSIYTYMESPGPAPRNFFFIVLQFSGSAKV